MFDIGAQKYLEPSFITVLTICWKEFWDERKTFRFFPGSSPSLFWGHWCTHNISELDFMFVSERAESMLGGTNGNVLMGHIDNFFSLLQMPWQNTRQKLGGLLFSHSSGDYKTEVSLVVSWYPLGSGWISSEARPWPRRWLFLCSLSCVHVPLRSPCLHFLFSWEHQSD